MSDHMQLFIYQKAPTFTADCAGCGATIYAHPDTGETEESLRDGSAHCDQCCDYADPDTVSAAGMLYAGRYSAPGYMDCTDWHYGSNLRELETELRDLYGDDNE